MLRSSEMRICFFSRFIVEEVWMYYNYVRCPRMCAQA